MADSIANLLLQISSEKGDAAADLGELAAGLEALDHSEANAEVNVDTGEALGELALFEAAIGRLDGKDAKVGVDADMDQLDLFARKLGDIVDTTWSGKFFKGDQGDFTRAFPEQLTMDLDVESAPALEELGAQLKLFESTHDINIDVDKSRGGIERAMSAFGGLASAFSSLGSQGAGVTDAFGGMGNALSKITVNVGAFGFSLGPLVVVVVTLAGAIAVSLVAALAALAASAAVAAAALGALAVAFLAALGPMLAVAIPALLMFGKVLKVLQQEQNEAAAAAQKKAQADQQARAYAQQHQDAERNLAQAIQARREATVQAYREMADAIEAVSDSYRSLERARLSQEQAALGIKQAELNLKNFRSETGLVGSSLDDMFKKFTDVDFKGNTDAIVGQLKGMTGQSLGGDNELELQRLVLAVRDARLSQKEATDGVSDAETNLSRAQETALDFQKRGIIASDQYVAAINRVADARRGLIRLEQNRAWELQNAELLKSQSQVAALSGQEQKLLDVVRELIAAFEDAFGPAVRALMDGIIDGLKGMGGAMKRLKGNLTGLGTAMGGAISGLLGGLASPEATELFQALIDGATVLAPLVTSIFGSMFELLGKIAVAAMPFLVAGFQAIAGWLSDLAENTSVQDISDALSDMMPHLQTWLDLGAKLGEGFLNLIIAAAPAGLDLAKSILDIATNLAAWAGSEEGRQQIKDFLANAIPLAKDFAWAVFQVVKWFIAMVETTKEVIDFFVLLWDAIFPLRWLLKKFWEQLKTDVEAVAGWLGMMSVKIENAWADVTAFLSGLPEQMFNAGADAVMGFIDGLWSKKDDLFGVAKDLFNIPGTIAEKILELGSPSKLMKDIGRNVGIGLQMGMESTASRVAGAANASLAAPVVAAGGLAAAAGGMTIMHQDVNLPAAPGHDQLGDPRVQAEMFAREMIRRGFNEVGAPS